ncbi:YncE family protein [candidate division KSB1 bacterium]|nr:YncE family protein [candidate division KSB1 bacterium]
MNILRRILALFWTFTVTMAASSQTIPVGKGPDALFLTPNERYLYVANVEDTFITVVDTRTDKVVQTIDGTDYPWGFARLGSSNLVAVSGWNKGVDVIDFTKHEIVRSKRYEHNLGGIVATDDGKTLFVIATEANKILKLDAGSLEILDEYPTGNGPDGVGLSKSGSKLYGTNTKDGTISIIDVKTKQATLLEVGHKPELIHANHDRSRLFISNFFANKIHIVDSNAGKIIHEITGLDGPEDAVLSKSEKILYVVNFNSSQVFSYDAKTYEKLPQEFVVGTKPIGIVSAVNDSRLYVSNYGDNSVAVILLHSQSKLSDRDTEREILVKFKASVKESQIAKLASELGLQQIKTIAALRLRVFHITSEKSVKEVITACEKQPFVEYAEANQKVGKKSEKN